MAFAESRAVFLPAALCFAVRLGVENTSFIVMSSSLKNKGWDQLTAVLNFTFSTDLKRIQTPCSLFRGFGADRTFTTRRSWNLSRRPFLAHVASLDLLLCTEFDADMQICSYSLFLPRDHE